MALRERFAFVLCRPRSAGNIGAAARALKNMGFDDLRLVAPESSERRQAAAMAVHAGDVLARATVYPDLAAATADCSVLAGTTARRGRYRAGAEPLRRAAASLVALSPANRIAIIFGAEDHGLTNRELKLCHRLITIPAAPEYPSLNLAQAVMVVAYELKIAGDKPPGEIEARRAPGFAAAAASEAMLRRMQESLLSIGFLPDNNPDHIMFAIRAIFGRSGLTAREVEILSGIARQMRWVAEGGHATIANKRRAGKKLR